MAKPKFELKCQKDSYDTVYFSIKNVSSVPVSNIHLESFDLIYLDKHRDNVLLFNNVFPTSLSSNQEVQFKYDHKYLRNRPATAFAFEMSFTFEDDDDTKYFCKASKNVQNMYDAQYAQGGWETEVFVNAQEMLEESDNKTSNETDDGQDLILLVDKIKSTLLSIATGGSVNDSEYKMMREEIISIPGIKQYVPRMIIINRNPLEFFRHMQSLSDTYKGRRQIIDNEFEKLYEVIEFGNINDEGIEIKQYEKCERLGRGGFGEVFRYHNVFLDMDFAVKIYDPSFASNDLRIEGEKRFFREAKMLFQLMHPNIVRIFDVGRISGKPFIRMEYIKGETLQKYRERLGLLSFATAGNLMKQILSGLQYAHNQGIVHRDLKPTNIMVCTDETKPHCVIIDFGISAFLDTSDHTKLTRTGEQIAGGLFIDPLLDSNPQMRDVRCDVYSAGAIMYYLLCGRSPVGGNAEMYLKQNNNTLSDGQISVVMKSISMDIDDRYQDCNSFSEAIKNEQNKGIIG